MGAQGGNKKKPTKGKEEVKDPKKTCMYCGKFDKNFDDNSLDIHCF